MKINTLFKRPDTTILNSIRAYRRILMDDMNLSIRLVYKDKTYSTRMVDLLDDVITFEAPMQGREYIILPNRATLNVIIVSKVALFQTAFKISKSYRKESKLYYTAVISAPIVKKQQRQAFRLDVTLDVHYDLIATEDQITPDNNSKVSGNGTCVNISLGGMCLVSDHQFHAHEQLMLAFDLGDTALKFLGQVLYLGEITEQGNYSHRIHFIGLDVADTNQLNRLIFEKQRSLLKRSQ